MAQYGQVWPGMVQSGTIYPEKDKPSALILLSRERAKLFSDDLSLAAFRHFKIHGILPATFGCSVSRTGTICFVVLTQLPPEFRARLLYILRAIIPKFYTLRLMFIYIFALI